MKTGKFQNEKGNSKKGNKKGNHEKEAEES